MKKGFIIGAAVLVAIGMQGGDVLRAVAAEVPAEVSPEEQAAAEQAAAEQQKLDAVYNIPVQTNELANWTKGPGTYGEAAIVMEAESGAILYAKNIDTKEYPASITKVLTALLAFENTALTDPVSITAHSLECLGSGYASIGVKEGNVITMEQALYATLLASANEVSCAVGETVAQKKGKDYNWFIEEMNRVSKELGGTNSNFVNTNGVHNEQHYTCARDMALIGKELWKYPEFLQISQTGQYTIPASPTTEEHIFQQKHEMLNAGSKNYYQYAVAGKTGYTTEADNTLITFGDNGDMKLVCVVLKTFPGHSYSDTQALFDYGFGNFQKVSIQEKETGKEFEAIDPKAYVVIPKDIKFADLKKSVRLEDDTAAVVQYSYKDIPVGEASATVSKSYLEKQKTNSKNNAEDGKETSKSTSTKNVKFKVAAVIVLIGVGGVGALLIRQRIILKKRKSIRAQSRHRRRIRKP